MPTLDYNGAVVSGNLARGEQVTVTASASGRALFERLRAGVAIAGDLIENSEVQVFGPYEFDFFYRLSAISALVIYEIAPFDSEASDVGLTHFTIDKAAIPSEPAEPEVASITATGTDSHISVALVPKGAGALQAQVSDHAVTGGFGRGEHAVDWQSQREDATHVAAGANSVIAGGYDNFSGFMCVVSGGQYNSAPTGVAGYNTVVGGYGNTANGSFNTVWGAQATTRALYGNAAHASGVFAASGDAQHGCYVMRATTTNATPKAVTADASAAGVGNQVVLPNSATYAFVGQLTAREPATGDSKGWKFEGVIRRGANAAATALVAAVTPTAIAADGGASTWALTVAADTTNGALALTVTGENSKTIQWVATVDTVENVG